MNSEIKKLIKTFESDNKGRKRYADFLQHCFLSVKMPKRKGNTKRVINKYDILRKDLINYLIANEKEITLELNK
tara:strand:- start:351 stop:572 length:222 start_codon:yes stop_codon:yes gene_type:complete